MKTKEFAAVIMAAGMGKRMKDPSMAKVMHKIGDAPLIEHVVELARSCNATKIIVIVGHQKESVMAHLRSLNCGIEFAMQEEQLGTGHAILQAYPLLEEFTGDILVLSGDVPLTRVQTIQALLQKHNEKAAAATVLTAVLPDPTGYGRILRRSDGTISGIVEQKDATDAERRIREINSGIYVFQAVPLFDALRGVTNDNAQGEYYLPDVIGIFAGRGLHMEPVIVESFDEIRGINTIEQLQEMEQLHRQRVHP
jgi:UDP-N-acetylglucosamine diphosphorylase/glucosamine-1-phosphate N-acetyltransferase